MRAVLAYVVGKFLANLFPVLGLIGLALGVLVLGLFLFAPRK